MKRALLLMIASLIAAWPSWAAAQVLLAHAPGPYYTSPAAIGTSQAQLIEGRILRMDASRTSVMLTNGTSLTIPHSASVTPDRGLLKPGAVIQATCYQEGGQKVASHVRVEGGSATHSG